MICLPLLCTYVLVSPEILQIMSLYLHSLQTVTKIRTPTTTFYCDKHYCKIFLGNVKLSLLKINLNNVCVHYIYLPLFRKFCTSGVMFLRVSAFPESCICFARFWNNRKKFRLISLSNH